AHHHHAGRHSFPTRRSSDLKDEVLTGTRGLAPLRDTLEKTRDEAARASAQTNLIVAELARRQEEVSVYDATSLARREHIEKLKRSEEHTSELQSPDHLVCRL